MKGKVNDRFNKWGKWIDKIHFEIVDLLIGRHIFGAVKDIIKNNPDIQKSSHFYDFLVIAYTVSASMGVRRQVKIDENSISIARLLKEICENPKELSRTRYIALYKGSSFDKVYRQIPMNETTEEFASKEFDKYVEKHLDDHIDPKMVSCELQTLNSKAKKLEKYADRRIAHYDKRSPKDIPTFLELDDCIDFLIKLVQKYYPLLTTLPPHLDPEDHIDENWKDIFKVAWIKEKRVPNREGLRQLVGTLTSEEAEAMQKIIDKEFERIEGEW